MSEARNARAIPTLSRIVCTCKVTTQIPGYSSVNGESSETGFSERVQDCTQFLLRGCIRARLMCMKDSAPERSSWARKAGGWCLLAAGVAGCVLPVIPGIPLALAGLIILARDYAWARSALRKAKRKAASMRRRSRLKKSGKTVVSRNAAAEEQPSEP